jgi:hypothetical protein
MQRQINVKHRIPGRIRLQVSGAKGQPDFFQQVDKVAKSVKGVRSVSTRPVTGSVIVDYDNRDPEVEDRLKVALHEASTLLSFAIPEVGEAEEIWKIAESDAEYIAEHSRIAASLIDAMESISQEVKRATHNIVDLKLLLPLGLAGYGLFFIDREKNSLAWSLLLLGSLHTFIVLHRPTSVRIPTVPDSRRHGSQKAPRSGHY